MLDTKPMTREQHHAIHKIAYLRSDLARLTAQQRQHSAFYRFTRKTLDEQNMIAYGSTR